MTDFDEHPPHFWGGGALYATLLLLGSLGLGLWSVWMPWISREDGRFVLSPSPGIVAAELSNPLVFGATALAGLAVLLVVWSMIFDRSLHAATRWAGSWARQHPLHAALILLVCLIGSVDIYELLYDPFNRLWGPDGSGGLRKWMIREDLQVWLALATALTGMLALWNFLRRGLDHPSFRMAVDGNWRPSAWALAAVTPVVMGAVMCRWALDGIPHFSDALTYLMQGRTLMSGRLWVPTPLHYDLFQHSLFYVETDGRFFGKYPVGWPLLLGLFDAAGLRFLANASLAGLLALLTGLTARQFSTRRVALLAALFVGLSPWVWFHGASFAAHVTSACAVMGFMWLFLGLLNEKPVDDDVAVTAPPASMPLAAIRGLAAGLCLGFGVLTRPQDALMFALPAVVVTLWQFARQPRRWVWLGPAVAVGALVGVGVYLWINTGTTGSPTLPPYKLEARWESDWNPAPGAVAARLMWYLAELNGRFPGWGIGGLTLAACGAVAAGRRWRSTGLRTLTASTLLFFGFCAAFGFTNVWWGPRWLLPAVPLLAILTAHLIDAAIRVLQTPWTSEPNGRGRRVAAALLLMLLLAGVDVSLLFRWGGQFYAHRIFPPHTVSAAAWDEVRSMGLNNAVVAMPTSGPRAPLDARAGMVFMTVPFETNEVIVIRAVDDWFAKAREMYPDRSLYVLEAAVAPQGFVIRRLTVGESGGLE